ncbi:MAG: alpha/beta hydrolase [Bacteroidetes bacterium]|nr:alpha/beta hydrolase [Bacteroidota bacterium]
MEFFANIIAKLITKLELANVLFVGHSFGGHLLLESYYQLRKAMAGLVIFGAPPMQIPPDIPAMFLPNEAAGLIFQEELKDHEISLLGKAFLKKGSIVPVTITTSIRNTDPKMRSAVGADLAEGNTKNEASIIAGADIPVAILHGEEDQLINGAYLKLITTPKLWENKVHYISNAGHMPQLEAPKQFNELLYRFSKHVFTKLI